MSGRDVDPLAYAPDADSSTLSEVARLDSIRDSIRAEQSSYLTQHPEILSLIDGFIGAVLEEQPVDVFAFARRHFAPDEDGEGAVVVIAGPSGAGKGTIIRKLMELLPGQLGFVCSHTTRHRRDGEEDGVHYHFTTVEAMEEGIRNGDFIEYAEVHGNLYGTSVAAVDVVVRRGQVCILDIDVQGVKTVKASRLRPKYIFISPPSIEVLEHRLRDRGTESEETLRTRLANAREEMEYGKVEGNFDVVVENDALERAVDELAEFLVRCYPKLSLQRGEGAHTSAGHLPSPADT